MLSYMYQIIQHYMFLEALYYFFLIYIQCKPSAFLKGCRLVRGNFIYSSQKVFCNSIKLRCFQDILCLRFYSCLIIFSQLQVLCACVPQRLKGGVILVARAFLFKLIVNANYSFKVRNLLSQQLVQRVACALQMRANC